MIETSRSYLRQGRYYMLRLYRFLKIDMWRLTPEETPSILRPLVSVIKVVYQTTRAGIEDNLLGKAASLTYSTVLSIVPMLAVIVGIAKGFGLQTVVRQALIDSLPGQQEQLDQTFVYVENYLNQVQGGLFIGLGLGILLYTVISLIATIEDTLNEIWQAPHGRPWSRRILDYLGLFILLPFLLTGSSLITLLTSTIRNTSLGEIALFQTLLSGALSLLPLIISMTLFVALYMFMPNVRVRFVPALISGVLAGLTYQVFQSIYIGGLIWISRYNAIYGSFAAFPLLLLFMQTAWTITLFGAQLSYAIQNIDSFTFGHVVDKTSRRYQDFVALLILQRILKRFDKVGAEPYTVEELSRECKIPLRLTAKVLSRLVQTGLIVELNWGKDNESRCYQPALSPEHLSVGFAIRQLDRYGTEDFRIDRKDKFQRVWQATLSSRSGKSEGEGIDRTTLIQNL